MTDATGVQTYAYDDADATLTRAFAYTGLPARTVAYAYDPDASRATMSLTGVSGQFSYSYDSAGRETGLTNPYGEAVTWAYLNNDWLASQSLAASGLTGAISAAFTYDARGQVTDLTNRQGATVVSDFAAPSAGGYDGAGNRLKVTATQPAQPSYGGATTYTYDGRDELTGEASARNGGYTDTQHYDGVTTGTTTGPGDPTTLRGGATHSFNADNQDAANSYDGDGSPVTYKGNSLKFDPEGRMAAYGSAETYGYTGDGLRAWRSNGGTPDYYLYDGDTVVGQMNADGSFNAVMTGGVNGLVSQRLLAAPASTLAYWFDPSGNAAGRVQPAGLNEYVTDGFGQRSGASPSQGSSRDYYTWFGSQWGGYTDSNTRRADAAGAPLLRHHDGPVPHPRPHRVRRRGQPLRVHCQ